jgi:hypothetical protein
MFAFIYEELVWTPVVAERRRFGFGAGAGFATLGLLLAWRSAGLTTGAGVAGTVGLALLAAALLCPAALLWPYRIWMGIVTPIAFVLQRLLLSVFFYFVLTPVGLVMRFCGRDPLKQGFDPAAPSYWEPSRSHRDLRRYFRQY